MPFYERRSKRFNRQIFRGWQMFFQIIETSSAGNCAFLEYEGTRILIDAGVGIRRVESYLRERGLTAEDIDAIFITHEHSDHCKALKSFSKFKTRVFANRLTCESIIHIYSDTKPLNWTTFENGVPFDFRGIGVSAFSIPHDTSDSVGYCFQLGGKCLVWMTDLGKVTLLAQDMAKRAQVLVLESNYCPRMLDNSSRPYRLKMRIKGSHGHLSNSDAISVLKLLSPDFAEKIYLAHISRECNSVTHISELLEGIGNIRSHIEIVSPFSETSSPYEIL